MTQQAFGTIAGHEVEFIPAYRQFNDSPVALQVTMTTPMSYEDITAVLFALVRDGMDLDDLDDENYVRRMVVETLLATSSADIEDARISLEEAERGTAEYALARAVRGRVTALFAQPVPSPRRNEKIGEVV